MEFEELKRLRTLPWIRCQTSYTWVERGTVRVKCLTHEHNTNIPSQGSNLVCSLKCNNKVKLYTICDNQCNLILSTQFQTVIYIHLTCDRVCCTCTR